MCLARRASGLWLRYATLQNLIPFFPGLRPPPSTLAQSKERKGSNFVIWHPPSLSLLGGRRNHRSDRSQLMVFSGAAWEARKRGGRSEGRKEERANRSEGERKEPDIYKWGRKGGKEGKERKPSPLALAMLEAYWAFAKPLGDFIVQLLAMFLHGDEEVCCWLFSHCSYESFPIHVYFVKTTGQEVNSEQRPKYDSSVAL